MRKEKDIVFETRKSWVLRERDCYTVFVVGATCSTSDCSFERTVAGLSLAIYRAFYHSRKTAPNTIALPAATCLALAHKTHQ